MRPSRSTSSSAALVGLARLAAFALATALARTAAAQACCAGSAAVVPARLEMDEDAVAGALVRGAVIHGSFDADGRYHPNADGASELDLEQDVVGAVRVARRGQLAALVPFVETRRHAAGTTDFGGGIGDVNLSARWDAVLAGEHDVVPGFAVLAGLTAPTGRAPDAASGPLAADATGIGAWQGNFGIAVEQSFGPWLAGGSAIVARRTERTYASQGTSVREDLGVAVTGLASLAYAFDADRAIALAASYTGEGVATIDGRATPSTDRRIVSLSLSGVAALGSFGRIQASVSAHPPITELGKNLPATIGVSVAVLHGWHPW